MLGSCIKLKYEERNVFSRVILLFTLNLIQDDENYGLQLYRYGYFFNPINTHYTPKVSLPQLERYKREVPDFHEMVHIRESKTKIVVSLLVCSFIS